MPIPLCFLSAVVRKGDVTRYCPSGWPACRAILHPQENPGPVARCLVAARPVACGEVQP